MVICVEYRAQAFVTRGGGAGLLVSGAKDGALKVWDLDTQHCCQTLGGHKAEVWALDVDPGETRVVTGGEEMAHVTAVTAVTARGMCAHVTGAWGQ